MALRVIVEKCSFAPDYGSGVVVVESDLEGPPFTAAFQELQAPEARQAAQSFAGSRGMGTAYINGNLVGPYPVNSEGLSLEEIRDTNGQPLPQDHLRMQPRYYRIEVPVMRPLR